MVVMLMLILAKKKKKKSHKRLEKKKVVKSKSYPQDIFKSSTKGYEQNKEHIISLT